jgi:hypothetical protein
LTDGEEAALDVYLSPSAAGSANARLGAGLGARTAAGLAGLRARKLNLGLRAEDGILEIDFEFVLQVRPAPSAAPAAAAKQIAEDIAEDVAEVGEVLSAVEAALPRAADAGVTGLVLAAPLLLVDQNRVGLGGLFEAILRVLIARIAVRVVLHGELAVGALHRFG